MNNKLIKNENVLLLSSMGDDYSIVRAARTSTSSDGKTKEGDLRLLRYLYKNKHTSPFEMVEFVFLIKAPLFVIRQWQRHRTWSYNEQSGRYKVFDIEFYTPEEYRGQSKTNKQASDGIISLPDDILAERDLIRQMSANLYHKLIDLGVARELARIDLPPSIFSTFVAKTDAHNLMGFLRLRLADDAQLEIREYAEALLILAQSVIPHTINFFLEEIRNATNYSWITNRGW